MGELQVRFRDAWRQPLNDSVDVRVVESATNIARAAKRNVPGRSVFAVRDLNPGQAYVITAMPRRYRPVGQVVILPPQGKAAVDLYFPLHPDHVQPRFRPYAELESRLRDVLERSALEGAPATGQALYDALQPTERAGLLNLYCKMSAFGFDEQHTVWTAVERIYRIRPDRIFAEVDVALRDRVKTAETEGRFREVNGTLHTPPTGYRAAGSFKTDDRYGNLQLSFFASEAAPIHFKVDADIDDAAGLAHTFQVLRNWVRDGTTHPYDIHQILVYRQEAFPPYDLA